MAKACAYLCRQCCFIDGFGEFGEFSRNVRKSANVDVYTGLSKKRRSVALLSHDRVRYGLP